MSNAEKLNEIRENMHAFIDRKLDDLVKDGASDDDLERFLSRFMVSGARQFADPPKNEACSPGRPMARVATCRKEKVPVTLDQIRAKKQEYLDAGGLEFLALPLRKELADRRHKCFDLEWDLRRFRFIYYHGRGVEYAKKMRFSVEKLMAISEAYFARAKKHRKKYLHYTNLTWFIKGLHLEGVNLHQEPEDKWAYEYSYLSEVFDELEV